MLITSRKDHIGMEHLNEPVTRVLRKDVPILNQQLTVQEALEHIRLHGVGERIVYFYVIDDEQRLVGVLPTRGLLTAALDRPISDIMIRSVISIPRTATVLDACEFFIFYKYLAFPVVDEDRRIQGIVDAEMFKEGILDVSDHEHMNEVFATIGFHVEQVREANPFMAFRRRFPWLIATITSGIICALLAGFYETTLAETILLAFFLTLVLGLGESVSMQAMTITVQALRSFHPTFRWYRQSFLREIGTAFLLGTACGLIVGSIALIWHGDPGVALVIGVSLLLIICTSCFFGLTIPSVLHALKLDPKVASGPLTLATADISTVVIYLTSAAIIL